MIHSKFFPNLIALHVLMYCQGLSWATLPVTMGDEQCDHCVLDSTLSPALTTSLCSRSYKWFYFILRLDSTSLFSFNLFPTGSTFFLICCFHFRELQQRQFYLCSFSPNTDMHFSLTFLKS